MVKEAVNIFGVKSKTMEYYSATKRNEALIHATAWTNLKGTLNNRNQKQKAAHDVIPFIGNVYNRQIQRQKAEE